MPSLREKMNVQLRSGMDVINLNNPINIEEQVRELSIEQTHYRKCDLESKIEGNEGALKESQ